MFLARKLHKFVKVSPLTMGVITGLGVFLPATLACGLLYYGGVHAIHEEIRGNLKRVAKAASLLVDTDLHKTFKDPAQESTPEYERAIEPLRRFVESDPAFMYVYTFVEDKGKIKFVLDPTPAADSDGDLVDDKSHIMEVYNEDGLEQMFTTARRHVPTAEEELSSDQWGTFISGYAPIFDKDGNYVASIGVDIAANRYASRLASLRRSGVVSVIVALGIAVLAGIAAAFFQRRRQEWTVEQEQSRDALEDLAHSLDGVNAQLRLSNRRFEHLFNNIPVACFTFDADGRIFEWNRESERLMGARAQDVVQRTLFESIVGEANHGMFHQLVEQVFQDRPVQDREWSDIGRDGQRFTVVLNCFPLYSPDGKVTGGIMACADITVRKELEGQIQQQMREIQTAYSELNNNKHTLTVTNAALSEANERLNTLATIDSLTGINNRRAIFAALERHMSSVSRSNRNLSVLMVDIDHFKSLNDVHGHIKGDLVLREVAKTLKNASRTHDEVGRYGGEEFLIVLPETDADEAVAVAERVRREVETHECGGLHVTVSIGIATYRESFVIAEQFIDAADRALYESKRNGRNRTTHVRDLTEGAA